MKLGELKKIIDAAFKKHGDKPIDIDDEGIRVIDPFDGCEGSGKIVEEILFDED